MIEKQIEAQVLEELKQIREQEEAIRNQRYLNSTNRDTFTPKDLS